MAEVLIYLREKTRPKASCPNFLFDRQILLFSSIKFGFERANIAMKVRKTKTPNQTNKIKNTF